jgi:hypothetical protein
VRRRPQTAFAVVQSTGYVVIGAISFTARGARMSGGQFWDEGNWAHGWEIAKKRGWRVHKIVIEVLP